MSRTLFRATGLLAGALAVAIAGSAASAETPVAQAETEAAGAVMLVAACFNCHGTDGRMQGSSIPAIAGVPRPVLLAQLLAFKAGEIPDTTVMDRIAAGFSDDELVAVAAYFAAQRADGDAPPRNAPAGADR
jgi:cytochrome subunit of sulfide dehydrogenase